jgi:hypothetical protein
MDNIVDVTMSLYDWYNISCQIKSRGSHESESLSLLT